MSTTPIAGAARLISIINQLDAQFPFEPSPDGKPWDMGLHDHLIGEAIAICTRLKLPAAYDQWSLQWGSLPYSDAWDRHNRWRGFIRSMREAATSLYADTPPNPHAPGSSNASDVPEYVNGYLTRRGMEQVIDKGGSVIIHWPGLANGVVERKEDLPSEEQLALIRPDPLNELTRETYVGWCETHIRKLTRLLGEYPDLRQKMAGNPSSVFVKTAGQLGLRLDATAAVAAAELFRDADHCPGNDPFEAIQKLNKMAVWARRLSCGGSAADKLTAPAVGPGRSQSSAGPSATGADEGDANPFQAIDRWARAVCHDSLTDLGNRLTSHPIIHGTRTANSRSRGDEFLCAASPLLVRAGVAFNNVETQLREVAAAVESMMGVDWWQGRRDDAVATWDRFCQGMQRCADATAAVLRLANAYLPDLPCQPAESAKAPTWDELSQRLLALRPAAEVPPAPVTPPSPPPAPAVVLGGANDEPMVRGKKKARLTTARYNVVKAMLNAGRLLTKDELDAKSGHTDARKILKALADSDPDWKSVIHFGRQTGGGYGIE